MNKPQHDIDEAWVKRYQEGKLSEEEQRWLKENPFEAGALEGLAEAPNWQQDITDLQQQLQERTYQRASLWVTYGRYAAAVAVLLIASWFVYQATLPEAPIEQLSYEIQSDTPGTAKKAPLALAPKKVDGEKAHSEVNNSTYSQPTKEIESVPVPEQEPLALLEPTASASPSPEAEADEETVDFIEEETERVDSEPMLLPSRQTQAKRARFAAPTDTFGHQITGKVYSADDRTPIPGVNVLVKGSTVGTITDENGQFQVTVSDSSKELVVSSIGYRPEEIAINQQNSLTIPLEADLQALSEVVVIRYGTKKSTLSQSAQPLPSRKEFRTYLQENLQYPEEARQQGIEGNVKVQFTVQANGELTNFIIKKSLGYGCDEEAVRLIKAKPNWQPALKDGELQDQEVTVKVRFRLPTR